jgi:hypothetical protein
VQLETHDAYTPSAPTVKEAASFTVAVGAVASTVTEGEPWTACVNDRRGHDGDHDFSRRLHGAHPELGIIGSERPWENAVLGERWTLTQGDDHDTQVWISQGPAAWRSESGRWWLPEDEDLAAIHHVVPAGPISCREAYPGALARVR